MYLASKDTHESSTPRSINSWTELFEIVIPGLCPLGLLNCTCLGSAVASPAGNRKCVGASISLRRQLTCRYVQALSTPPLQPVIQATTLLSIMSAASRTLLNRVSA